jgi:hypothetical protein
MLKASRRERTCCAAICAMLVGLFAARARGDFVDTYDAEVGRSSVLLSYLNGASPYSGVGRYEGRLTCSAFFLETVFHPGAPHDAPAYAVTSGDCAADLGPNDILIDGDGVGRVIFNLFADSERWKVAVPVARTAYATTKGRSLAVLELAMSYRELQRQVVRPWRVSADSSAVAGDLIAVVGVPARSDPAQDRLRLASCRMEGVAPVVVEDTRYLFDTQFNRCRDVTRGSSGSPVFSVIERRVMGTISTTTGHAKPLSDCAPGNPCELVSERWRSRPDTNYVSSLAGLALCFDPRRRFSVLETGCPLDPGTQLRAFPSALGPVNPRLAMPPRGPIHRSWNVTVAGNQPFYRYAIVTPRLTDCRTTDSYSTDRSVTTAPVIDAPLPLAEGFAFLCIWGTGVEENLDGLARPMDPTIVVARIDTTPPRLPAQITIEESTAAWRVNFHSIGHEVSFHTYKVGPPRETRCDDPEGYRFADATSIGLPKLKGPYRLCAIPYDAAQNAGRRFERLL